MATLDWKRAPNPAPGSASRLVVEELETRTLPSVTAALAGGVLSITGTPERDNIIVSLDAARVELVVYDFAQEAARFASTAVTRISIDGAGGQDRILVDPSVTQPADLVAGPGGAVLRAGSGSTNLLG